MAENAELPAWSPDRLALLARAAVESGRAGRGAEKDEILSAVAAAAKAAGGAGAVKPLFGQIEGQMGGARPTSDPPAAKAVAVEVGSMSDVLKQRASLELKLAQEAQARKDVETSLARHREEHAIAMESLSLQKQKVKELQDERGRLLADIRRVEDQLRVQINDNEQLQLKMQKVQESRKAVGDQTVSQAEQINALKAENEELKRRVEDTLRDHDTVRQSAAAEVQAAEAQTADTVLHGLWAEMSKTWPELIVPTHVPNARTFENLCEAFIEMVRAMSVIEAHNLAMLKELRQVGEAGDKLANYYLSLTKNPNLVATLRDFLPGQRRSNNVVQLLRSLQGWARALATGPFKAIVSSPDVLRNEFNYRNWPIKIGFTTGEDAPIGKYFKETYKDASDRVGMALRREAGDAAYRDFTEMWKQIR